jgi:flagellar basal-body rod protein FlgB
MPGSLIQGTSIPALEEVIRFTQSRHALLAGNIANLDTPDYRVRDLSPEVFEQRLRQALDIQHRYHEPVTPGLAEVPDNDPMREVRESVKSILYHDGSDVGLEQQVLQMTNNQLMHNLAISIMSSQFRLLQTAISERV